MNETYLYPYSAQEARTRNQLPMWRESYHAKAVPAPKPKRTAKSAVPKTPSSEPKPMAVTVKEGN